MDFALEKECSALGGLFQCIINDIKGSGPVWEDLAGKATKLQVQLKATIQALNFFLDSLQRVADLATNAKGATKDIGTALTRICMRHRSIENRLKTLSSALIDCLVLPLQGKIEEWRQVAIKMDKDHVKDYKRNRGEIKKRANDTIRLQKKVRKGNNTMQRMLDTAAKDVNDRYLMLLESERLAVKQALIEQRSQFCVFVSWFKPIMDGELAMLGELPHLNEVVDLMCKHSADPYILPPASEAVIMDVKGLENTWKFQTPPSSPGSSLGSRKSSFCSLNSSSDGTPSQASSHYGHLVPMQNPQSPKYQKSSLSSQDSGFTSQDALHHNQLQGIAAAVAAKTPNNDADGSPVSSTSSQSTPSPSPSSVTCPAAANGPYAVAGVATISAAARPHTISGACDSRTILRRPPLNSNTFTPTRPTSLKPVLTPTVEARILASNCDESDAALMPPPPSVPSVFRSGRPPKMPSKRSLPATPMNPNAKFIPAVPDFNRSQPDQVIPQPIYMNVVELQRQNSDPRHRGTSPARSDPGNKQRPSSFVGDDDFINLLNATNAEAAGSITPRASEHDMSDAAYVQECMDHINRLSLDLDDYCQSSDAVTRTNENSLRTPPKANAINNSVVGASVSLTTPSKGIELSHSINTTNMHGHHAVIRRHSMNTKPPPPPTRRNSSITGGAQVPMPDRIRTRCTTPVDDPNYAAMIRGLNTRGDGPSVYQKPPPHPCVESSPSATVYYRQMTEQGAGIRQSQYAYYQHGVGGGRFDAEPRASSEPPLPPPPPPELLRSFGDPLPQNGNQGDARSALMSEILNGVRLRRTVTNDRSEPRI